VLAFLYFLFKVGWRGLANWSAVILLYNDVQRKKAEALVHKMVKRAVEMEGTVTVSLGTKPRIQAGS
jgi:hypothetical protein